MKRIFTKILIVVSLVGIFALLYLVSQPSLNITLKGNVDLMVTSVLVNDKPVDPSGSEVTFKSGPGFGKHSIRVLVQGIEQYKEDIDLGPFSSKSIEVQVRDLDKEKILNDQKQSLGIVEPTFDSVISNDGKWLAYRVGEGSSKRIVIARRESTSDEWETLNTEISDGGYALDSMPAEIKEYLDTL